MTSVPPTWQLLNNTQKANSKTYITRTDLDTVITDEDEHAIPSFRK